MTSAALNDLKAKLNDTTFLLGPFRRRAALRRLAALGDPKAARILGEALCSRHSASRSIETALREIDPETEQPKIDCLWGVWAENRSDESKCERLEQILREQGRRATEKKLAVLSLLKLEKESRLPGGAPAARAILRYLRDDDRDVRQSVLRYAEALPADDGVNDEIYRRWAQSASSELEDLIQQQGRKPTEPELEALFLLATGDVAAFLELADPQGELFLGAFLRAPAAMRQRINRTVLRRGNAKLVAAYQNAMSQHEEHDPRLVIDAYKSAGDDDGLFDAARDLTLGRGARPLRVVGRARIATQ